MGVMHNVFLRGVCFIQNTHNMSPLPATRAELKRLRNCVRELTLEQDKLKHQRRQFRNLYREYYHKFFWKLDKYRWRLTKTILILFAAFFISLCVLDFKYGSKKSDLLSRAESLQL